MGKLKRCELVIPIELYRRIEIELWNRRTQGGRFDLDHRRKKPIAMSFISWLTEACTEKLSRIKIKRQEEKTNS